jgi:hypothetical protein
MPIQKRNGIVLPCSHFSLYSAFKLKTLITEIVKVKNRMILIHIHILIYNFSYQHWSVSQFLLAYPENPDIAVAMAADEEA